MQVRTMPDLMGRSIDQVRDRRVSKKLQHLGKENRRLRAEIEATRDELDRERHERVDQLHAVEKRAKKKGRRSGIIRMAAVGFGAYLMGARAGRERYDAIMSKIKSDGSDDTTSGTLSTPTMRLDSPPSS